jgi:hypothetical protein
MALVSKNMWVMETTVLNLQNQNNIVSFEINPTKICQNSKKSNLAQAQKRL